MLKDVTFGQYYPADSFIHKMDARIKLVLCMLYMVGIFFVTSFVGFAFITIFLSVWSIGCGSGSEEASGLLPEAPGVPVEDGVDGYQPPEPPEEPEPLPGFCGCPDWLSSFASDTGSNTGSVTSAEIALISS